MAMLAVAFLNVATVKSTVMQATGSTSGLDNSRMAVAEICHAGLPLHVAAKAAIDPAKAQKACPYCDAAANPPLCGAEASFPSPSTIAWTRYTVLPSLGARGPPAFAPNARGPPNPILTL